MIRIRLRAVEIHKRWLKAPVPNRESRRCPKAYPQVWLCTALRSEVSHGVGGWWNRMGVFFSNSFPIYFVSETHEATLLHQLETLDASTGLARVTVNICYATQTWAIKLRLHSYIVLGGSARILWKCSHSPDLKWSLQRQMIKYTAGLFPSITTAHRLKHSFFIALQMSEHKFLSALLPRFLGDSR